jgi:hypothetical protein
MGVIGPVYHRQHGKRSRLDLEDDDDSASHETVAGSSTTNAYQGPASASADAQRINKRPRNGMTPTGHIEQSNLAIQMHQSDFGEDYERVHRPLRVRIVDDYASGSRDLNHAILLGAGTPFPSPSRESIPLYSYVEEYAYASDGDDYEEEDKDERRYADDEREVGQERENDLVTQLPVTVAEGGEDNDDHGEDVGVVTDEF